MSMTRSPVFLMITLACSKFVVLSLCQRLDSARQTHERAPKARVQTSAKREHERRRRESSPEARDERRRRESLAGGAEIPRSGIESLLLWHNFLSPSNHVTCQNRIRPFTEKHRFIARLDYLRPEPGYRVPENALAPGTSCMLLLDIDLGRVILGLTVGCKRFRSYSICAGSLLWCIFC